MARSILFLVLLLIFPKAFAGSIYDNEYSASASLSGGASLLLKKLVNKDGAYLVGFDAYYSDRESVDYRPNYSTLDPNDRMAYTSQQKNGKLSFSGGFRKYGSQTEYRYFFQPIIGLIASFEERNYFDELDENKNLSRSKALTLGVGASVGLGVEYMISEKISVEGVYSLGAEYLDYDFKGESKRKSLYLSEGASIYASYYW